MSFRLRLTIALLGLVSAISLIYTLILVTFMHWSEDAMIDAFLKRTWAVIETTNLTEFCPCEYSGITITTNPEPHFRDLSLGAHELADLHLLVTEHKGARWFYFIDETHSPVTRVEEQVYITLVILLVVSLLAALLISVLLSHILSKPLEKLVHKLLRQPFSAKQASQLTSKNEIIYLENIFDETLERMGDFIAREQALTHSASHELRNPLAVLQANLQLLDSVPCPSDQHAKIYARMHRAVKSMEMITETCLMLAREDEANSRATDINLSTLLSNKLAELELCTSPETSITDNIVVRAELGLLTILLDNILVNAVKHGNGTIYISLTEKHLVVLNQHDNTNKQAHGYRMGRIISTRIAQVFGWKIRFTRGASKFMARIEF